MRHLCLLPLCLLLLVGCGLTTPRTVCAATYYVDNGSPGAADTNPGTSAAPWKTLGRAAGAAELRPGDTVLVRSGVYREAVTITVSGTPGRPVTFAAAPGAEVVIKWSKVVTGDWTSVSGDPTLTEPYPNAYSSVWKIHLDDSYFRGLPPDGHYLSDIFLGDTTALQEIGQDPIYSDPGSLSPVGKGLSSIYQNAFYFDKATQTLYIDYDGRPEWYTIEVGTIPFPLQVNGVHDVTIRGFQVRQNRQPGHNWVMTQVDDSRRVIVSHCAFTYSDFGGFSFGTCRDCKIVDSTMSDNGDTGTGFYMCHDCVVDHCRIVGNNTRHFNVGWHAGGAKSIPDNVRCTIENCVGGDNDGPGIWFDDGNADCRILHNVIYNNQGGVMYEISPGGATIADNLIFANRGRGIYISGSEGAKIYDNTVAGNDTGIVLMPREAPHALDDCLVQNNLLLHNDTAAQEFRGCDLTLFLGLDAAGKRTVPDNHSRSNLYATGPGMPGITANWGGNFSLADWQRKFGEDRDSRATSFLYEDMGDAFRLTDPQAAAKRAIATPLPAGLPWRPADPKLVGSSLTAWPMSGP